MGRAATCVSLTRPAAVPSPTIIKGLDDRHYITMYRQRDACFARVNRDASSGVLALLGVAETGARGAKPRLQATVTEGARRVVFPRRAAFTLTAAAQEAVEKGRAYLWLPLQLTAPEELHANAVWVDITARRAILFEPHGSDAQHVGHRGCGWENFYVSEQYFDAFRSLVAAALPGFTAVVPSEYMPPVFGQSLSNVRGIGRGDPWCMLWSLMFLHEVTADRGDPAKFVARIVRLTADGGLELHVLSKLKTSTSWMGEL